MGVFIPPEAQYVEILGCHFGGHDHMVENHGKDVVIAWNTMDAAKEFRER